jgi:hypothetical protein
MPFRLALVWAVVASLSCSVTAFAFPDTAVYFPVACGWVVILICVTVGTQRPSDGSWRPRNRHRRSPEPVPARAQSGLYDRWLDG